MPNVARGIQRILHLGAPPPPVVIGLVWKPVGSKDAPHRALIEQEAGTVPAPVGYAAIPRPAVWFFDNLAQADPAKTE